ncbi:MAG TPA: polysaccharide deacetylase family protein, partial [Blastocatellia bacterium]
PVMRDLSVPALIFVPTSIIGADYQSSKEFSRRLKYAGILEMMTWDDLRELRSQGFDIGSHTRTHRRLSELNADESLLREEIIGSKLDLEDNLGAECKYISWPYGRRVDVDDASLRLIRQSGYTACFGAFRGGIYEDRRPDSFSVPRHHFEVQWPMRHINYFARGGREG